MKTIARELTSVKTTSSDATYEVSKIAFFILLTTAMGFGILSISALIAGAIKAGGIIPLIGMMFTAL